MKVLIQMKYNTAIDRKIRLLRKEHPHLELYTDLERTPLENIQVLVGGTLEPDFLQQFSSLKLIIVPFAGVNHLPLTYLREHSIALSTCHSNAAFVAERALGMLLSLMGRITEYHNDLRQERWHGYWVGGGMDDAWSSLHGKTCGILGTGAIGTQLAKLLKSFDCPVLGFRHSSLDIPPPFDRITSDLASLISQSEVIFAALPLTKATHGIIGEVQLSAMAGKILVNVGRGNLVDEKALYHALVEGNLAGAALDTWYTYPSGKNSCPPSRYPIHQLKNVILSPHVAGFSREGLGFSLDSTFLNLSTYLESGRVVNPVNLLEEY